MFRWLMFRRPRRRQVVLEGAVYDVVSACLDAAIRKTASLPFPEDRIAVLQQYLGAAMVAIQHELQGLPGATSITMRCAMVENDRGNPVIEMHARIGFGTWTRLHAMEMTDRYLQQCAVSIANELNIPVAVAVQIPCFTKEGQWDFFEEAHRILRDIQRRS